MEIHVLFLLLLNYANQTEMTVHRFPSQKGYQLSHRHRGRDQGWSPQSLGSRSDWGSGVLVKSLNLYLHQPVSRHFITDGAITVSGCSPTPTTLVKPAICLPYPFYSFLFSTYHFLTHCIVYLYLIFIANCPSSPCRKINNSKSWVFVYVCPNALSTRNHAWVIAGAAEQLFTK